MLKDVNGADEAIGAASCAIKAAKEMGVEGVLVGGRTDVCIYAAIMAAESGLKVYQAETKRIRTEDDKFIFNLAGVTRIKLDCFFDGYFGPGVNIG